MSKQTRARDARTRLAEVQAEQARAERKRRLAIAGTAIAVIIAIIATFVGLRLAGVGGPKSSGSASTTASDAVTKAISSVPASTLDSVGAGTAQGGPAKINAPALTADGKPLVLYLGAEYCPFCAAERWGLAVALSRFGTWTNLGQTTSSSADVYPNTATLSFHGAKYDSKYVAFRGYETTTNELVGNSYKPLDTVSPEDQKVIESYNKAPYTSGGIPFVNIGGVYVSSGSFFSPEILAGMSHEEIANAISDPKSAVGKAVGGTANVFTAAICEVTGHQPANVCTSPGVVAAAKNLTTAG